MKKLGLLLLLSKVLVAEEPWIETTLANENLGIEHYTMRDDIAYVEFRKALFNNDTNKQVSEKYIPYFKIAKKKLDSYPKKIVTRFRKLEFQKNSKKIITLPTISRSHSLRVNGFMIKEDNTFLSMSEVQDVAWVFNGIDTLSELLSFCTIINQPFMLSRKINNHSKRIIIYRKVVDGYEFQLQGSSTIVVDSNTLSKYREIDIHIVHIRKNGKSSTRLGKSYLEEIPYKNEAIGVFFHPDPFYMSLREEQKVGYILENSNFITP